MSAGLLSVCHQLKYFVIPHTVPLSYPLQTLPLEKKGKEGIFFAMKQHREVFDKHQSIMKPKFFWKH